nr:hypothetical protein [Ktedonobacterales bacterium]
LLLRGLTALDVLLGGGSLLRLALQAAALGGLCALVVWWRWRRGLSPEAGILALSTVWILVSPHLFPWYIAVLLPFLAFFPRGVAQPLMPLGRDAWRAWVVRAVAAPEGARVMALWLFALAMPFTYIIFAPGGRPELFLWFFFVPLAVAALPLLWAARRPLGRGAMPVVGAAPPLSLSSEE